MRIQTFLSKVFILSITFNHFREIVENRASNVKTVTYTNNKIVIDPMYLCTYIEVQIFSQKIIESSYQCNKVQNNLSICMIVCLSMRLFTLSSESINRFKYSFQYCTLANFP